MNRTIDIPLDYRGSMGVPITFLHKFNPKQFEIISFRKGNDGKDLSVNGKCPYFRVLIRYKKITKGVFLMISLTKKDFKKFYPKIK